MTFIDPSGKLLQHIDRLAQIKAGGSPPPVNVEIDLSNRCSLGCEWCHFAYTHTRGPLKGKREKPENATAGGDLMPLYLAYRIIDELAAAGVESITWTGGGEPTLHPNFNDIIQYASGKIAQGIYTHGGHIADGRAALMKQCMTFVYVSLDAVNAEDYKLHKGVDRFDAAIKGIRALVRAEGDATIGVGFLITEDNFRDAHEARALSMSLGADYVQFRPTIAYENSDPGAPGEDTAWLTKAMSVVGAVATLDGVEADMSRFSMYRDWEGHGYPMCWWSKLQSVITPNGKMWTCVNKREFSGHEIGDLSAESFESIWGKNKVAEVDESCRLMCRGHVANKTLYEILQPREHSKFI